MSSPATVRLSKETRRRIARIARDQRTSASDVMRKAIEEWIDKQEATPTPYELMKDLIGIGHGGDPNRSTATGRQFTELLKRRRERR